VKEEVTRTLPVVKRDRIAVGGRLLRRAMLVVGVVVVVSKN
jgi:hypothetical protein